MYELYNSNYYFSFREVIHDPLNKIKTEVEFSRDTWTRSTDEKGPELKDQSPILLVYSKEDPFKVKVLT